MFERDRKIEWTAEHERTLRALTVNEHTPGTIVHDFNALLSFVRERDLSVTKTNRLRDDLIVHSDLRHAPALGAAVDAYLNWIK